MRTKRSGSVLAMAALASGAFLAAAQASEKGHKIVTPEKIEWSPGPASIPPGAESAVLYGDPSEEGVFALRLKLPEGYTIPPHTHPRPEIVTVVSGTLHVGMGETIDRQGTEVLSSGGFFAFEPGMAHYVFTEGETVLQLNSSGPWALEYVNPADDPRS